MGASVEAVENGASIIHLHVMEENEEATISTVAAARYYEVIKAIRERVPNVVLEITCRGVDMESNLAEVVERGNLDANTVIVNPISAVEQQIERIYELGCTPRCDVYDIGDILITKRLLDKGVLKAPVQYLLILGSYSGIGAERSDLEFMVRHLPKDAIWTALGTGRFNFPVAEYALELGGHLRTGFEDCTYIAKGVKAKSNGELVNKLAEISATSGVRPAGLLEARSMMGFEPKATDKSTF